MKRSISVFIACFMVAALGISGIIAPKAAAASKTPVAVNGQLTLKGTQLVNQNGKAVQLKGISSHGLQWYGDYVNKDSLKWLRDDWGINVFRAAMYTAEGGYIDNPSVKNKVKEAVEAAKELGIYVIIDWHILSDGNPNQNKAKAKEFLTKCQDFMARRQTSFLKLPTSRTAMSTGIATLNLTPKKSCP